MPLSIGAGLAATAFSGGSGPDWASPATHFSAGKPKQAIQSAIRNLTGLRLGMDGTDHTKTEFDIWRALNPFDMGEAIAWKTTFWTALLLRGAKAVTHKDMVNSIPLINKYVKGS